MENPQIDRHEMRDLAGDWTTCAVGECLRNLRIPSKKRRTVAISNPQIHNLGSDFHDHIIAGDWERAAWCLGQIRKVTRQNKTELVRFSDLLIG